MKIRESNSNRPKSPGKWMQLLASRTVSEISPMIGWGFTDTDLDQLDYIYHNINIGWFNTDDEELYQKIEKTIKKRILDLLTDCNFHKECGALESGKHINESLKLKEADAEDTVTFKSSDVKNFEIFASGGGVDIIWGELNDGRFFMGEYKPNPGGMILDEAPWKEDGTAKEWDWEEEEKHIIGYVPDDVFAGICNSLSSYKNESLKESKAKLIGVWDEYPYTEKDAPRIAQCGKYFAWNNVNGGCFEFFTRNPANEEDPYKFEITKNSIPADIVNDLTSVILDNVLDAEQREELMNDLGEMNESEITKKVKCESMTSDNTAKLNEDVVDLYSTVKSCLANVNLELGKDVDVEDTLEDHSGNVVSMQMYISDRYGYETFNFNDDGTESEDDVPSVDTIMKRIEKSLKGTGIVFKKLTRYTFIVELQSVGNDKYYAAKITSSMTGINIFLLGKDKDVVKQNSKEFFDRFFKFIELGDGDDAYEEYYIPEIEEYFNENGLVVVNDEDWDSDIAARDRGDGKETLTFKNVPVEVVASVEDRF